MSNSRKATPLEAHFDAHFDETVEEIRAYLRQPGFSHTGIGIRESAELTRELLAKAGSTDLELVETGGNPVVFGHLRSGRPGAKTVLLYSHYDQTAVGVEADWVAPPLDAAIVDAPAIGVPSHVGKVMVARASNDYRGPLAAAVLTFKAMREVTGDIPVNVIWVIDGEEEIGAPNLHAFVERKVDELMPADVLWMPGMHQDANGVMQVYRGYKGTAKVEIHITSGEWGGTLSAKDSWSANLPWLDAPLLRLIRALSTMLDADDHLTIDGLDDLILPPDDEDREQLELMRRDLDEGAIKTALGIERFKNGRGAGDLLEDFVMGAMMNVVGITGGYTGPRVYTTLPMKVSAKLDLRFPPNVSYAEIPDLLRRHLDRRGFNEVEIEVHGGYDFARTSARTDVYRAALRACDELGCKYVVWPIKPAVGPFSPFNHPPLSKPVIFVGMGHGAKWHEPNEYITVEGIRDFQRYMARFLEEWASA